MAPRIDVHLGLGPKLATLWNAAVGERSWVENDVGVGRISLPSNDSQATPDLIDASLVYVIWSDQGLPPWVGYAPDDYDNDGQSYSLSLVGYEHQLSYWFTGSNETYAESAGSALRKAFAAAALRTPGMPLTLGEFGDPGPALSKTWRNDALLDVATQYAKDAERLWWVDWSVWSGDISGRLRFGARRGQDRSDTVTLQDGVNIAAGVTERRRHGAPLQVAIAVGTTSGGTAYSARPQAIVQAATVANALAQTTTTRSATVDHDERLADTQSALLAATAAIAAKRPHYVSAGVVDPDLWPVLFLDDVVRLHLGATYNLGRGIDSAARVVGVQPNEAGGRVELLLQLVEDSDAD
jgi:hypothetical protein